MPLIAWLWVAGLLGIALQLHQATLDSVSFYAGVVGCALVLAAGVWFGRRFAFRAAQARAACLALALASAALGFGTTGLRASAQAQERLLPALEGRDLDVVGVIERMPQRTPQGIRFRLLVESAHAAGLAVTLPPRLDVGWYNGFARQEGGQLELQRRFDASGEPQPGARWQLRVRLKAPHGTRNPDGFDYELWLWEQGVGATGYVRATPNDPAPRVIGQATGLAALGFAVERARQQVRDRLYAAVPDAKVAGVLVALVVGDQRAIDRADWDIYRATGVAHLMSISGLHVTLFAWLAAAVVGWTWRRSARTLPQLCLNVPASIAGAWGGLFLAWSYAVFSGWGVPSQRTVWMLAAVVVVRSVGVRWPWLWRWLAAAVVVALVDPWALLQSGFWLSFVAVGVLCASDPGRAPRPKQKSANDPENVANNDGRYWTYGRFWQKLVKTVRGAAREQLLITVALAPLTLLLFGQVSVVGLLANAFAIPWTTLVVTPLAMLGVIFAPFWDVAAWAVACMNGALTVLSAWPWATLSVPIAPVGVGVCAVVGGVLMAMQMPFAARALGLPLMLPVLFWHNSPLPVGVFELIAADVGQGNAVLVRTANHALLYDAGPAYSPESDAGHRVLVPLLRARGVVLDAVMLSHRDIDHSGGAAAVLGMQPRARLTSSLETGHPLLRLRPTAQTRCAAGQRWVWDGVHFEVLHPQIQAYEGAERSNAMSCVLKIQADASSGRRTGAAPVALLVADIEADQERALVARGLRGPVDWLLMPHHGSKTSSTDLFLDAVQPRFAIAQAGYRNRFSHPAREVLDRYQARGITVFNTATTGALSWRSDDAGAVLSERARRARYWQHQPQP